MAVVYVYMLGVQKSESARGGEVQLYERKPRWARNRNRDGYIKSAHEAETWVHGARYRCTQKMMKRCAGEERAAMQRAKEIQFG